MVVVVVVVVVVVGHGCGRSWSWSVVVAIGGRGRRWSVIVGHGRQLSLVMVVTVTITHLVVGAARHRCYPRARCSEVCDLKICCDAHQHVLGGLRAGDLAAGQRRGVDLWEINASCIAVGSVGEM